MIAQIVAKSKLGGGDEPEGKKFCFQCGIYHPKSYGCPKGGKLCAAKMETREPALTGKRGSGRRWTSPLAMMGAGCGWAVIKATVMDISPSKGVNK